MRHRLNPYLTVVVRPPTLVQLGASATGAPVLRPPPWLAPDTTAGLLRWLQTFRTPRELERRAADIGMTAADVGELLDALRGHGLLESEPPRSPLQVHLHGKGPVSDTMLGELAALGVGTLCLSVISTQLTFLSYGTTARAARFFGAGDRAAAAAVTADCMNWVCAALSRLR